MILVSKVCDVRSCYHFIHFRGRTIACTMEHDDRVFSNNPADYNRVLCMACTAKVKVHHMKKHLESHQMSVDCYKMMYGQEWEYVNKVYHK